MFKCYHAYKIFNSYKKNRIKPYDKQKKVVSVFLENYEELLFYYFVFSFFVCKNYANNLDSFILNFYLEKSSGDFFDASQDLVKILRVHAIDESTGKYVPNVTAKIQRIQRLKDCWYIYFESWFKQITKDVAFFDILCNKDCIDLSLSDAASEFSNRKAIVSSEYLLLISSFINRYRENKDVDFLNSLMSLKHTIYIKDIYYFIDKVVFNKFGDDDFYTKEIFYHRYFDDFIRHHNFFGDLSQNKTNSSILDFDLIASLHALNESLQLEASHESSLKLFFYSKKGSRVHRRSLCYNCNVPVSEPWFYKYTNKGEVDLCVRCKQEIYERSFSAVDALNKALPGSFGNKK